MGQRHLLTANGLQEQSHEKNEKMTTTELIKSLDPRLAVGTVWGKVPSSGCYGSTKHATKRLGAFFIWSWRI